MKPVPLIFYVLIFSFLHSPLSIQAADPPFYWEFVNVNIAVQENGDMLITETRKYVFTAPHTTERYRYIPLDKVERIDHIQVFEEDRALTTKTGIENNQFLDTMASCA